MSSSWRPTFLFVTCQCGAEAALKKELEVQRLGLRPSFSRPGFVTFKFERVCDNPAGFQLHSTFARSWGFSLGNVRGDEVGALATGCWQLPVIVELLKSLPLEDLHVWERDRLLPGDGDFEPGQSSLAAEVDRALRSHCPDERLQTRGIPRAARSSQPNIWVLDVVIVEPSEWWLGCHRTYSRSACWVGGVPRLAVPHDMVSRAYLKMAEALEWSALPVTRGDVCVELGCAPGGAAQALLDRGLFVVGVDPAAVEPEVAEHPRFLHVRRRSVAVTKREIARARWLAADMNVAPEYTLDAVEDIVLHKTASIRGMVLTLKLIDWSLAGEIGRYVERVRSWGYRDVRTRQLAFNRQEFCLVALRSRGQRRVKRGGGRRRLRYDEPHPGIPGTIHLEK